MENVNPASNDEISLKDIIIKIKRGYRFLISKWLTILFVSLLGGILGLAYSLFKKPQYIATCTFVLEEGGKGGALSQYAGLASLAGIDLNGGGGSIFQGDNILELYKSRTMIEQTLLSNADFNGRTEKIIDYYIDFNDLREKWKKSKGLENISFNESPEKFKRKQDSIVTSIVDVINKKILSVGKPDKKLNIINVSVTSEDELFSQIFTIKLVENVNTFYIQTKTKRSNQNVKVLQRQADSVRAVLNGSIGGVASAVDATPNANPLRSTLRVPSEKKRIDVQASSTIYGEIVKNLELSKISLQQETPLIQIIDSPVLPLNIKKVSKKEGIAIGLIIGLLITTTYILLKKTFKKILYDD